MYQLFIYTLLLFSSNALIHESKKINFSINLIHRDSRLSPFHNSSVTPYQLMRQAAIRSYSRANFLYSSMHFDDKQYVSSLMEYDGEYILEISVGTAPVVFFAIADTGSNLVWVKCSVDYKPQHFHPSSSSTYENVSYGSEFCRAIPKTNVGDLNTCEYRYKYGDRSYTSGILGNDTFHLNSTTGVSHPFSGVVFGCSKKQYLNMGNGLYHGVVGLGAGMLSLVSQLKSRIEYKFSYCLVPVYTRMISKLRFGSKETISGVEVVSTPLIFEDPPRFYHLSLKSVSIGKNRTITSEDQGNIMIDSGTPLTMLHSSLYNSLETIVKEAIDSTPVLDPPDKLKLCYKGKSIIPDDIPEMVFNFDGADIHLLSAHTFFQYDAKMICMAIVPTDNRPIFGSMAQVNFEVEFDLQNRKVSFVQTNCTTK